METIRSSSPAVNGLARPRAGGADRLTLDKAPRADEPAPTPPASAPLRRGLSRLDPQLQGQVANAQQALDYLDQVAGQLQALKGELSAKIASYQSEKRALEAQLRQLNDTLSRRQQAAGANLDAQLEFSPEAPANQRFRMRNLDMAALQSGPAKVLSFSVGGSSQPLTLSIESGLSAEQIAQRFDRALAPAKVRAKLDANGALVFSTPEQGWPMVRDSLTLQGSGRVATETEAVPIAPQNWGADNSEQLRRTLHEVVLALAHVQRSRDAASQALSAATTRAAIQQAPAADMDALAQDFADTAGKPNYESLLALTSALVGISRERVVSLLGLR